MTTLHKTIETFHHQHQLHTRTSNAPRGNQQFEKMLDQMKDAILEAGKIGISADRAMDCSEESGCVAAAYRSLAASAKRARSAAPPGFLRAERQASCAPVGASEQA